MLRNDAVFLGEDWSTKGDFFGLYGRDFTVLCAANSPVNHYITWANTPCWINACLGPHKRSTDFLRHWLQSLNEGNNRNVLYDPVLGIRRQGSWDDHKQAYPMAHDGPDIWVRTSVLKGRYRLSFYFHNKDGDRNIERFRDYLVEQKGFHFNLESAMNSPTLSQTRISDYFGGVYKIFIVDDEGTLWTKIGSNWSFNTEVCGVMLNKLEGKVQHQCYDQLSYLGNYIFPVQDVKSVNDSAFLALWTHADDHLKYRHGAFL